jgi:hypothetical protein
VKAKLGLDDLYVSFPLDHRDELLRQAMVDGERVFNVYDDLQDFADRVADLSKTARTIELTRLARRARVILPSAGDFDVWCKKAAKVSGDDRADIKAMAPKATKDKEGPMDPRDFVDAWMKTYKAADGSPRLM